MFDLAVNLIIVVSIIGAFALGLFIALGLPRPKNER